MIIAMKESHFSVIRIIIDYILNLNLYLFRMAEAAGIQLPINN